MKKRKWLIPVLVIMVLLAVASIMLISGMNQNTADISGTGEVLRGNLSAFVTANGTLVEKEKRDVYVDTPVRVTAILVDKDMPVSKGQAVLEVDLTDLKSQLEQARLNRDSQELTLKRVRDIGNTQSLESLQLAVRQAETMLVSDRSSLARTKADYDTNKKLHVTGAISDSEFLRYERAWQDAQSRVSLSEISLSSAQANLANSRTNNGKSDDQRVLDIATQENMLKLQALNVKTLEDRLAKVESAIVSPMDGIITVMNAVEGVSLTSMQPAYRISDLATLEVKEVESGRVKLGQMVGITGDGIDESLRVAGVITGISSVATVVRSSTGDETVVQATVTITDPPEGLRPGLTVTADIVTDTRTDVPVIRYAMLTEDENGKTAVFQFINGIAVITPIQLGITAELDIEVTDGLSGGETLILNPPLTLKDGMKVRVTGEKGGFFGGMGP